MIKTLAVQVAVATERGTRDTNEDFAGYTLGPAGPPNPTHGAAAIADGVGGAKGGRIAAQLAARTFLDAHRTLDPLRNAKTTTSTAIEAINRWLLRLEMLYDIKLDIINDICYFRKRNQRAYGLWIFLIIIVFRGL